MLLLLLLTLMKMEHHWELRQSEKIASDVATPPPSSTMSSPTPSSPTRRTSDDSSDSGEDLDDAWDRSRQALIASVPVMEEDEEESWEDEYERYLKDLQRDVTRDTDLVQWWSVSNHMYYLFQRLTNKLQENAERYPTLARIAIDVLPVQASAVACERLFSAGKHIANVTRSRLDNSKFEQLQILKNAWRKDLKDLARENEDFVEEVPGDITDVSLFAELDLFDQEDNEWDAEEDAIA